MQELKKLLSELCEKISSGKEFPFWEFLNKSEKLMKNISSNVNGEIEEGVVVKGNLVLSKGSVIKSGTYIEGNVVIGDNCKIGPRAYLRKGTIIGNNCHIGNSEIKNSIILDNSNVPHFSYVGDSILGENVNFGAGTKVANLRFDNKNVKVSFNAKKVDSGRRKLGCLIGNDVKTGINSSINCGVVIKNNSFIKPGEIVEENK